MKQFYTYFGLNFKTFISFVNDLPSASRYAMRK